MKLAWIAAALLATLGCEKEPSKLDKLASTAPAPGAGGGGGGDLEARVARLEKKIGTIDKGAFDLLAAAYQAKVDEEDNQPKQGVVYGIDIAQNVQTFHLEGAPDALVTIVEAFDFA